MPKIMLVEDDPMIAEIYKKKFEAVGFDVVNAASGTEVLKLAAAQDFDLVLLDMVLPEMNGLEVLKELKKSGNFKADLRVIVLTNLSKAEHEAEAKENGADAFIGKTQFSPTELVSEVQRLLNSYAEQQKNKERAAGNGQTASQKKKILFIEDEDIFVEMFGKKLEDDGYELEYAKSGVLGSKLASEKIYDLIITDLVMPGMAGDEIIRRIKLDDKTKDIPIIVLSAYLHQEDIEPVREMGVADFFEKTHVVPSDLSRRVSELLK